MPNSNRPILIVGMAEPEAKTLRDAADDVGVPVTSLASCEEATAQVDDMAPVALVLRMDAEGAARTFAHVRSQAHFAQVPIFGATDELNDLAFTELFVWGGDDLITLSTALPITRRLRALLSRVPKGSPPSVEKPQAIVAGADANWRTVMGRALYNGGFSIRFATTVESFIEEGLQEGLTIAVVADDLGGEEQPEGARKAIETLRKRDSQVACVLVTPPKGMATAGAALKPLGRIAVADGYAPPENVLFLVNELLAARGVDKRASARLLYGTAVAFRAAGREGDEIGFSYNVSDGGVFVRTLAPLDQAQEVWLEMWPPRTERRVRLAGHVAWSRPFGAGWGATVPPGFGVRVDDGLTGDIDRWRAGCQAFSTSMLGG